MPLLFSAPRPGLVSVMSISVWPVLPMVRCSWSAFDPGPPRKASSPRKLWPVAATNGALMVSTSPSWPLTMLSTPLAVAEPLLKTPRSLNAELVAAAAGALSPTWTRPVLVRVLVGAPAAVPKSLVPRVSQVPSLVKVT